MKTMDQVAKIRAALLYILKEIPSGADYIKIFKILYFAQQAHLVTYGRVIIEDSFNALKRGPVPAFLYKALRHYAEGLEQSKEIEFCVDKISIDNHSGIPMFSTMESPDLDELSESDIVCLDNAIKKYIKVDSGLLSDMSHEDNAWIKANERYNEDPELGNRITAIEIARAGNASDSVIEYIRENQLIDRALCYNE